MTKLVSVLKNGLCLATDYVPSAYSVSVGLWLPIGSASENLGNSGLSHFYEHIVFKGTKNRSAFQIASEIEDLGGNLNAYTSREVTCFYISIANEHLQTAISVLADLAMEPKLSKADFEKEKSVVLEEIRSVEDNPEELSDDFFHKAHFKDCGYELPIAGSLDSVQNLKISEIHKRQKYILEECPILLSVAGAAKHNELLDICDQAFFKKKGAANMPNTAFCASSGTELLKKHVQQATVLWGTSCSGVSAKEARALQIFNQAFGYGFTSRLFQNIREKHGLVYSINSSFETSIQRAIDKKNSAMFQISFAAEPQNLERVADLIRKEMKRFLRDGFSNGELERAKSGIIGYSKLLKDSLSSRQSHLARQVIRHGHALNSKENEIEIKKMEADYIEECVRNLAKNYPWTFAAIVPKKFHCCLAKDLHSV
ncbi:MAG: insulinase family protein [Fibromonadaceae bacterium]|jgi:predicted Zn-dependent peptidase|nr:insulinase family protein [Fibromonadaceae bacterium]